jgi:hypothetical protein
VKGRHWRIHRRIRIAEASRVNPRAGVWQRQPPPYTIRRPRTGSSFDDFLKEEGAYEEVVAKALKRALAEQLEEGMQSAKLTKVAMARRTSTSRSQLERVLDPENVSVQRDTLLKAARAVGKTVATRPKKLAA